MEEDNISEIVSLSEKRYRLKMEQFELETKGRQAKRDSLLDELNEMTIIMTRMGGMDRTNKKELYVPQFSNIKTSDDLSVVNYNDYEFKVDNDLIRRDYRVSCVLHLNDPEFMIERKLIREGLEDRIVQESNSYDLKTKEKVLVFYSKEKD
ncbi:hypothetical protein HON71_02435 [Candidatus Woesearchaeota archaeon]|jgi:hypothetical protein|nr:hypothetical protein [Candidatus Woesearchaeota archaeon]MBT5342028.1 hypothetical protein [Candidatus Woesearchaeota archaeon]